MAPVRRLAPVAVAWLAIAGAALPARADAPPDPGMACPQIAAALDRQNATIKEQEEKKAALVAAPKDPGDADPAIAERLADIRADRATKQANLLVALGRKKGCFK